jgi:hypothetical protein
VFNVISARKKLRMTLEKIAMRAARHHYDTNNSRSTD